MSSHPCTSSSTNHTTSAVPCKKKMHLRLHLQLPSLQCNECHQSSCLTSCLAVRNDSYSRTVPGWLTDWVKGKCLFFKFVREMSQAECWANQCPGMAWPGLTGGGVMLEYFIIEMFILVICKYYRFTFLLNYYSVVKSIGTGMFTIHHK